MWRCESGEGAPTALSSKLWLLHPCYIVVLFRGLFNSKSRWHLLRSSAGRLQSLIWQYRARVGKFDVGFAASMDSAETILANELNQWRDTLSASATLKATSFAQSYDSSTFTHFQHSGLPDAGDSDDHQSPVQATRYMGIVQKPMFKNL